MNITQLFINLSLGVLSNTSVGMDGAGTIRDTDRARVVKYANEGLIRLFSRYSLLEKTVIIEMREGRTTYPLSSEFAVSNQEPDDSDENFFIIDTNETFTNDVIKIRTVYDSFGRSLALNDEENRDSVFTPSPKVLQVPRSIPGAALGINYQAKHPPLSVEDLSQEIILPDTLEGALDAFIAWKIYANMNTAESSAKAQEHQQNFDSICTEVVLNDLVNSSISTTNTKFHKRGWV